MMKLSGELYELLSHTHGEARVRLLPESRIYAAHFPDFPVTPGVTLVQMAVELIRMQEERPLEIAAAKNIKFLIPIPPGTELWYCYSGSGDEEWDVTVYRDDAACARMNLTLK